MKYIGRLLGWILLGVNAVMAGLLLFSAYSPYINPQEHSLLSCAGLAFPIFLVVNVLFVLFWLVVYRRYMLLSMLALIGCWNTIRTYIPINLLREEKPEKVLKFLSYNTMAFALGERHTKESPNPVLAYLAGSDADIICIQECIWMGKMKQKEADYALREYKYKHYYSFANGYNGLACYSRYPILKATPIEYKGSRNGSIVYRIAIGEDTLTVFNNHLESNKIEASEKAIYKEMIETPNKENLSSGVQMLLKKLKEASGIRSLQADSIAGLIEALPHQKIVVCGDFNDSPVSYTHRVISNHLKDAFVESGNGLGITYHENRFYFRIDHILLSENLNAYECTVDRSVKVSDHYPIWCYISLK